jgi:hypothetical protein
MTSFVNVVSDRAQAQNDTVPTFDKVQYPHKYRVADGHFHIYLSGTYGCDGLPLSAENWPGLWEQLHPVPEDLCKQFWTGGGHNSAGVEGPSMHAWAKENANELCRLRKL